MKRKIQKLSLMSLLVGATLVAFAKSDGCDASWAPFWKTSCTYTSFDQNGELVMYEKTCSHFIFTIKCTTQPLYDM
jgi:hypothetical protein